nr:MAG TPA: Structural protein [Caudoviricetes sp.]
MTEYISIQSSQDVIRHFGTKGMRWGHRKSKEFYTKRYIDKGYNPREARRKADKRMVLNRRLKTGAKIAGGVALAGLAAYGAYKGYNHIKAKQLEDAARNANIRKAFELPKTKFRKGAGKPEGFTYEKFVPERTYFGPDIRKGVKAQSDAVASKIGQRHEYAAKEMKKAFGNIYKNDSARDAKINKQFDEIDSLLKDLGVGSSRGANGRRIKDVTNSLR